MPPPYRVLPLPWTVLSVVLLLVAACAFAPAGAAHDGTWLQLGAPVRLGSPLLRDEDGQRLVAIGAEAVDDVPELLDAWEFRDATGWRRIELPQPPFWERGLSVGFFADPAHRRFLTPLYDTGPLVTMKMKFWALELGPPARWVEFDSSGVPYGQVYMDAGGEALWVFTSYPQRQLWTRSLADSGQWRLLRALPADPAGLVNRGVDPERGRVVALGRKLASGDSVVVWTMPLEGTAEWSQLPRPAPWPRWPGSSVTVSDVARNRLLLLAWDEAGGPAPTSWAFDLAGSSEWTDLGPTLQRDPGPSLAVWGDSLWGWRRDAAAQVIRLVTVPLESPAAWRVPHEAVWPGIWQFGLSAYDAVGSRRLFVGGPTPYSSSWVDSLLELKLNGNAAQWRFVPVPGPTPVGLGVIAWTADETNGVLYLLLRTSPWSSAGPEQGELWALHVEEPPRWSLLWSGVGPAAEGQGAMAFDPRSRRLLRFGYYDPALAPVNQVWTLDVDAPREWQLSRPNGLAVPSYVEYWSVVVDPIRERVVYTGSISAAAGTVGCLQLGSGLQWTGSSLRCDPAGSGECVQQNTRGVFDPIGHRAIQFGGWNMFEMHSYDDLWAVDSGDTLGPLRLLDVLGSPGRQEASPAGYDPARDALVTFDYWSGGLYEFRFDRGQAVVARSLSSVALADRNCLRWSSSPAAGFQLWRCTTTTEWAEIASLVASASGELAFDDRAIESGTRYGYRLTTSPSSLKPASADVWLTAATSGSVALAAPWPNPAPGALNVAFTTVAASPADLELFDIAGRRVWSRRWNAPAAGPHHVAVGAGDLPRSGLYFLRLRQAGLTSTRRVVLAP